MSQMIDFTVPSTVPGRYRTFKIGNRNNSDSVRYNCVYACDFAGSNVDVHPLDRQINGRGSQSKRSGKTA